MFIGHFAVGFAAKKAIPRTSLGTAFVAAQFLDLLWPVFLLLGWEHVRIDPGNTKVTPLDFYDYPITHSLIGVLGWSVLFGGLYFLLFRRARAAIVLGTCVLSHWILDLLVHRPDLPIGFSGGPYFGLGLWNQVPFVHILELGLFTGGLWLYLQATSARDKLGKISLIGLVATLLLIWVSNIFGPPPPSVEAIGVVGNAQWLFVAWGYWVDRHRVEPGIAV